MAKFKTTPNANHSIKSADRQSAKAFIQDAAEDYIPADIEKCNESMKLDAEDEYKNEHDPYDGIVDFKDQPQVIKNLEGVEIGGDDAASFLGANQTIPDDWFEEPYYDYDPIKGDYIYHTA